MVTERGVPALPAYGTRLIGLPTSFVSFVECILYEYLLSTSERACRPTADLYGNTGTSPYKCCRWDHINYYFGEQFDGFFWIIRA